MHTGPTCDSMYVPAWQVHPVEPVAPLVSEPVLHPVQLSKCVPPLAALYVFTGQGTADPAVSFSHPQK